MVKRIAVCVAVLVLAVGGFAGLKFFQMRQLAAKYKDAKEIASATITKDRSIWTMKIDSVFAAPLDAVWNAMQHPERSQQHVPEVFRRSALEKEAGNVKTLTFEIQVLGLPSQTLTAYVTYDPGDRSMAVVTEKGLQDLNVTYTLTALTPDRTLLTYAGTAEEKVSLPLPSQSIIEGALRELFVAQVRAIQKEIGAAKAG